MNKSTDNLSDQPVQRVSRLKNMGLFLVSPFIGLYYAVMLPGKLIALAKAEMQAKASAGSPSDRA